MRQQSAKRRAEATTRKEIVRRAIGPGAMCALLVVDAAGDCYGGVVGHELVKRSQLRGAHLDERLIIALCSGHNSWVEDHPLDAQRLGVAIPRWVWDQMGEQALVEAAMLRQAAAMGRPRMPSWFQT